MPGEALVPACVAVRNLTSEIFIELFARSHTKKPCIYDVSRFACTALREECEKQYFKFWGAVCFFSMLSFSVDECGITYGCRHYLFFRASVLLPSDTSLLKAQVFMV